MKRKGPWFGKNSGLTLNELIVVLVIVSVLAAVAIPAMIGTIRHGQQNNRTNIARTLYVAMQGQLTRAVAEGNLRTVLTDGFYERDSEGNLIRASGEVYYTLIDDDPANLYFGQVYARLGANFPDDDDENSDYVFFISKPAGFVRNSGSAADDTPVDKFFDLLDEVIIDKSILDDAILMEFNIRTGVVLSIFYGDLDTFWFLPGNQVNNRHFVYDDGGGNDNVIGARGMGDDGYAYASLRRQGYFGVTHTGVLPPLPIDEIVRIFDGMSFFDSYGAEPGLNVGTSSVPDRRVNVLFAEFLLLRQLDSAGARGFELFCEDTGADLITILDPYYDMQNDFDAALTHSLAVDTHALYYDYDAEIEVNQFGINVAGSFHRYIWILDYIEGDLFAQPHNIHTRYGNEISEPLNVRARLTMDNAPAINSFYVANTHFAAELPNGMFEVTSVRHLNNIRYFPAYNYLQTAHIDVSTLAVTPLGGGEPTWNFMPIGLSGAGGMGPQVSFTGTYSAVRGAYSQWRIENLRIHVDSAAFGNVGLFTEIRGTVDGGTAVNAGVVGISLFNARIHAPNAGNVGAIAGVLGGGGPVGGVHGYGRISRSNSFSNVLGGTVGNTGGLVGRIDNRGELSYSFNAGFFNTHPRPDMPIDQSTRTENGVGSVIGGLAAGTSPIAGHANIGGLVGRNDGVIRMSYNNARVNIYDVDLTYEPYLLSYSPVFTPVVENVSLYLGGIAGHNNGIIERSYATNYVAQYAGGSSGGIAGLNSGDITDSYFIANGAFGLGAVTKEYLWDVDFGSGFSSVHMHMHGNNLYTHYPYPILPNNMPFDYIQADFSAGILSQQWGWEDIDEVHIGTVVMVYFEVYENGSYGFWPPIHLPGGGALAPLRNNAHVVQAGYMVVVTMDEFVSAGPSNLQLFVRPGNIANAVPWALGDLVEPIEFTPATANMAFDADDYYVWVSKLDLGELENRLGTNINNAHIPLRFLSTANTLEEINDETYEDAEFIEGLMHPLFASAIFSYDRNLNTIYEYEIRTPWQMQNIDRVNTGTEATWIPPTPGGGVAIPPSVSETYNDTGVIGNPHTWAIGTFLGVPVARDIPSVPETRIDSIRINSQLGTRLTVTPAGATIISADGSGNVTVTGGTPSGSFSQVGCIFISAGSGTVTLVGDFTGVNIYNSNDWMADSLSLGAPGNPFSTGVTSGLRTNIYSVNTINIHLANNSVLRNANIASSQMIIFAPDTVSTGVVLDALFYARGDISGTINVSGWNVNTLPQFYSFGWGAINLTFTGSPIMSGVFFTTDLEVNLPGVVEFNGLFYSSNEFIVTPSTVNIRVTPALPGTGVLDPAVEAYLVGRGWQFPDGGINGGGEAGRPALAFRQTRNIDFYADRGFSAETNGDSGDGTSPVSPYPANAVVRRQFDGIFDGQGNTISSVSLTVNAEMPNGLFSINNGTIRNLILVNLDMTGDAGGQPGGGIAGINNGIIESCRIDGSSITGTLNVGGAVGSNHGNIRQLAVEYSTVSGVENVGGVAGLNATGGRIEDVYFLSTNHITEVPVSGNISIGGIVGRNNAISAFYGAEDLGGGVTRAFYYAPAPSYPSSEQVDETTQNITVFRPIVGEGTRAERTLREVLVEEEVINDEIIIEWGYMPFETTFFLRGHRYRTPVHVGAGAAWIEQNYNFRIDRTARIHGGGSGNRSDFINMDWLEFVYYLELDADIWRQSSVGYPYPYLIDLGIPRMWSITDSPPRPDQVSRNDWAEHTPTIERPTPLEFINGHFTDRNFSPGTTYGGYVITGEAVGSPGTRRIFVHQQGVPGWNTRPVTAAGFAGTHSGTGTPLWQMIELQDPRNSGTGTADMLHDYAYSNHRGGFNVPPNVFISPHRYAELNAEVPGTLYQISPTSPGAGYYYSFFHTSRLDGAGTTTASEMLYFYLSGIPDGVSEFVSNAPELAARDAILTFIRPARSPRTVTTAAISVTGAWNATAWNPIARNTVAYGLYDMSFHSGQTYWQPQSSLHPNGAWVTQPQLGNVYLFDVWVGDTTGATRNGFGITFWSTVNHAVPGVIPTAGISLSAFQTGTAAWLSAARNNIIGFWGVEFGWKHFYGFYEVPMGQTRTEFAFQSQTPTPTSGNFLSGVSFRAPAFISVDQFIRDEFDNSTNPLFVQPGDELTVDVRVSNVGEIPADNIVITNQLYPFNSYIGFRPGTVSATLNDVALTGLSIQAPTTGNNYTVTITLPPAVRVQQDDNLIIRFGIDVLRTVLDQDNVDTDVPTFLYHFWNQSVVQFREDSRDFRGGAYSPNHHLYAFRQIINYNASVPMQVFIDPIELHKTVSTVGHTGTDDDPLIDGPFDVTLLVENTAPGGGIATTGMVNMIVPSHFVVDENWTRENNPLLNIVFVRDPLDGTTRISARGVNLGVIRERNVNVRLSLREPIRAHGVSFVGITAEYRYLYRDLDMIGFDEPINVMLSFPQRVVGIRPRPQSSSYTVLFEQEPELAVGVGRTAVLDILGDTLVARLADGGYVAPIAYDMIRLLGEATTGATASIVEGAFQIETGYFRARLVQHGAAPGSGPGVSLEFTPLVSESRTFVFNFDILFRPRLDGGDPESFNLDSAIQTVTVNVVLACECVDCDCDADCACRIGDACACIAGAADIIDYVNGFDVNGDDDATPQNGGNGAIPDDDNGLPPNGNSNGNGNGNGNGVPSNGNGVPPNNGNGMPPGNGNGAPSNGGT